MGIERCKNQISERGKIKNHVFQGVSNASRIFYDLVPQDSEWLVYFDPDVDGVIAGYLACKFLAKHNRRFTWFINSNRAHGWFLPIERVKGKNIISVDFIVSSSKLDELCNAGCNVICMDHHLNGPDLITSKVNNFEGVIINNQYADEDLDGRYLSGAGVVFETLISLDPSFDELINRQLVAITLLSDNRNIENPLAEGYLYPLYSGKYTGLIKYLIESTIGDKDYSFGVPRMDRNYVDYKFSPAINACFRYNRQDEVVGYFLGVNQLDLGWRDLQKSLVNAIIEKSRVIEFTNLRVCYFYEEDFPSKKDIMSNFVGLVASKYLDGSHSVISYLISRLNGKPYMKRASFRGRVNGIDYNKALMDAGLFDCQGHEGAFGIAGLKPSKALFMKVNVICCKLETESGYKRNIIQVVNMSFFVGKNAYKIAEDNMYKLSQNQIRIKYTGNNVVVSRQGASFIEYKVDGIPVLCFDLKKSLSECLINPVLDRGTLTFYLE